jgi:phosphatidate cytidylyltransferase
MLHLRIIFGLIFASLAIGIIWLDTFLSAQWPGGAWKLPRGALIAMAAVPLIIMALREMANLLEKENVQISRRICSAAALLCMIWPWLVQIAQQVQGGTGPGNEFLRAPFFSTSRPAYVVPTVLAAALVAAIARYSRKQRVEGTMANAGGSLLAIVYLGVLPGFFLPIVVTHGAWMFLGIIAIVKAADVGAYTTGRLIGQHKLIPWLSPGKTVEGFFGGLVFSAAIGVLVAHLRGDMALVAGAALGLALGAVGQLGDLLESLLKRDAGVKDSGHVPGFGGVLDLLDSPLLAAPVAYWLLKLVTKT